MKKSYFNLTALIDHLSLSEKDSTIYQKIECQTSLFLFSKKHFIR